MRSLLLILLLALLWPHSVRAQEDVAAHLHSLFEDYWADQLERNPLFATSVGVHDYNHLLPEVGVEASERWLAAAGDFLERLHSVERSLLDREDQINYDIFQRQLQDAIREAEFKSYYMPLRNWGDFYTSFPELGDRMPFRNTGDYQNYISRLNAFETYVQQHIELMREGVAEGFTMPAVTIERFHEATLPHIVLDPAESLLWGPFEDIPDNIPAEERRALLQAGRAAILESVVPGYEAFHEFMSSEYVPAGRESVAIADVPGGREYYEHRVRLFTTLDDMTARQVHEAGLAEVARIRAEMEAAIRATGFDGSFAEFTEFLRTDERFYVDSPEELLRHAAAVGKRMDGELPRLFGTLPRMSWGIREVPDYIAPRTTTAYYSRPSGDGLRAGFYYVNTHNLSDRPLYEIEALTLHEAVPGHHLQIALQQEIENMPEFRRYAGFTAFVEGWALYAERLGLEVGFYEDPYSNFGRLSYEMWRALRLVVDTGMHAFDWSREQAIDFMAENSALTLHNITTEVDRYIAWPGQALAYKTGELKIRELRDRAEQELGSAFDVRAFHDVVLQSGAVPLTVLEENVLAWIADRP